MADGQCEVVQLRRAPPLNDIPGQLRQLADEIESGTLVGVTAAYGLVVHDDGSSPGIYGWGATNDNDLVVQLELAKLWLLRCRLGENPS